MGWWSGKLDDLIDGIEWFDFSNVKLVDEDNLSWYFTAIDVKEGNHVPCELQVWKKNFMLFYREDNRVDWIKIDTVFD